MSLPDRSIDPKILKSAKDEFLSKGYADASLRAICQSAGVTTGALYKRFPNKEALFSAVLEPTLKDIERITAETEKRDYDYLEKDQTQIIWDMSEETLQNLVNFVYDRYDGFRLLFCCAEGSPYGNFLHDFVTDYTKKTIAFTEAASKRSGFEVQVDELELHMLLTAFLSTLFEPLIHGLSREEALRHCSFVAKLFNWNAVLGF